jgi:hypothetical protein
MFFVAERRIEEAIARGELDDLPGTGRPLERLAYRILKNAGYVPPEVDALREISQLERLLQRDDPDAATHAKAVKKLALLRTTIESAYYAKVLARLAR